MQNEHNKYPEDSLFGNGYLIPLVANFSLILSMGNPSLEIKEQFLYGIDFSHQDNRLPFNTVSEIERFSYFIESFLKNFMPKDKIYTEQAMQYMHTHKESTDFLMIIFKANSSQKENKTILLDRTQCYILSKEIPKVITYMQQLYTTNIRKEISEHNFGIMHITEPWS